MASIITETTNDTNHQIHQIILDILLDESGSMMDRRKVVLSGLKEFFQDQKMNLPHGVSCSVSLHVFNTTLRTLFQNRPLEEVEDLQPHEYVPQRSTALFDAFGSRLEYFKTVGTDPHTKRLILVVTDGEENASQTVSLETLKGLVKDTENIVEVVYMGSNQDAILNGRHLGATRGASLNYNDESLGDALRATSSAIGRVVNGRSRTVEYTSVERSTSSGIHRNIRQDIRSRMDRIRRSSYVTSDSSTSTIVGDDPFETQQDFIPFDENVDEEDDSNTIPMPVLSRRSSV
jgi:hypothetical protein